MHRISVLMLIGLVFGTNVAYAISVLEATTRGREELLLGRGGIQAPSPAAQLVLDRDGSATTASNTSEKSVKPIQGAPAVNYSEELTRLFEMSRPEFLAALEKNYSGEGLRLLRAAALSGNADAQVILACFYGQGVRESENMPEGIRWLRAAAEQGHEYAKTMLQGACASCNHQASSDLARLSEALKRLNNELEDLNIREDQRKEFVTKHKDRILSYLRGPYYGWRGSHVFCRTHLRVVGDEVWACSPVTALAGRDPKTSKIFRARLFEGTIEAETRGPCGGVELSSRWPCYLDSMIDDDLPLTFREPIPMNCDKLYRSISQAPDGVCKEFGISRSAREGDAEAQFKLGTVYSDRESSQEELAEAVKWFHKATEQGHDGAKAALAEVKARLAKMKGK